MVYKQINKLQCALRRWKALTFLWIYHEVLSNSECKGYLMEGIVGNWWQSAIEKAFIAKPLDLCPTWFIFKYAAWIKKENQIMRVLCEASISNRVGGDLQHDVSTHRRPVGVVKRRNIHMQIFTKYVFGPVLTWTATIMHINESTDHFTALEGHKSVDYSTKKSDLPWNLSTYLFLVCIPDKWRLHWFFSVKLTQYTYLDLPLLLDTRVKNGGKRLTLSILI